MTAQKRVTPPAGEPVALAEARAFLRVSGTEDDTMIGTFLSAARARVEEAAGRALMPQTWRMSADVDEGKVRMGFRVFALKPAPYLSFVEARVALHDGTSRVIGTQDVRIDADGGHVWLRPGDLNGARMWRPIEIVWVAGYPSADAVPDPLKAAMLLLAAAMWERRDSVGAPVAALPEEVAGLIAPYRAVRL